MCVVTVQWLVIDHRGVLLGFVASGERVVIERFTPAHVGTYACVVETPNGKTRWGEWIVQQADV